MRILVTGGAGYVASVSVERLADAGHDVVVLDDLSTGHREAVPDGVPLEVGSYGDAATLDAVFGRHPVDAILHCAARSLVGESVQEPARYYRANVAGGIALLDGALRAGVKRIVFSSTAAVYGIPTITPIPETAPPAPINPYGETKRTFEGALRFYGEAYGLRSIALRYFNVAGASERNGELHDPETHLIPNILRAVETGRPITLFGEDYPTPDGTCIRDYIHVSDLADAHLLALEATAGSLPAGPAAPAAGSAVAPSAAESTTGAPSAPTSNDAPWAAFNLGIGGGYSVRQVVAAAEQVVGRAIPTTMGPRRPGDPPVLVAAVEGARTVLGWEARRPTLEEMIGSAWEWRQRNAARLAV